MKAKPMKVKHILVVATLSGFSWIGVAGAWETGQQTLSQDRVLTMTVLEKSWSIGGVAVDQIGNVYVADFAETVWKVTPEGEVAPFATGLYGASGNAFDARGSLFQANFSANTVSKINRAGEVTTYVDEGLSGPVGIAIAPDGSLYVCNCRSNTIARVSPEREVTELASLAGHLSGCPNGITFGPDEKLYVVGFGRSVVLEITLDGEVSTLTEISGGWLGHLVFAYGDLYVTSFGTHQIYRVDLEGGVEVLAGSPERGIAGGNLSAARFSNPNGIAVEPSSRTLFVNSFDAEWGLPGRSQPPARMILSRIDLVSLLELMVSALDARGVEAAVAAYRDYKSDPRHAEENTLRGINYLGYLLLTTRRDHDAAIAVFELNTEAYPDQARVWDSLADGHRARGDRERAVELYEKALELDATNTKTRQKLEALRAGE